VTSSPTLRRFSRSSLRYYWRTNLAVVLGVAAATAVIAGALIVGDSVRASLRQMSLDRLGGVDHVLTGHRFFRQSLAETAKIAGVEQERATVTSAHLAPAIVMPASLKRTDPEDGTRITRAGGVMVYAADDRLWSLIAPSGLAGPTGDDVVLNRRTAAQLGAEVGDELSLLMEIPPSIPRDSLLGDRDQTTTELLVTVTAIVDESSPLGRFGLNPSQQIPLNACVSLATMQRQLGLSEVPATQRNPVAKPARVNTLFVGRTGGIIDDDYAIAPFTAESWTWGLASQTKLTDLGLKLTEHPGGYFALESDQMLLEDSVVEAALKVAQELKFENSPVLVYLLNRIGTPTQGPGEPEAGYAMYSVVAGVDFESDSPFGPFEYLAGGPPDGSSSKPGDTTLPIPAVINEWLADDLEDLGGDGTLIDVGERVPIEYHVVGSRGELPVEQRELRIDGIAAMQGVAADRGFTPEVEGVTDVESYGDWREPFPLDEEAITPRDDAYWKAHRATPKVFLRLETAQELWQSRYGALTSLRFAPPAGMTVEEAEQQFRSRLEQSLDPTETGLAFVPIKQIGLDAATGTNDFSMLFLVFSGFLIASALLLVGLLFRLGVEQRLPEIGLLQAVGLTPTLVNRILRRQGLVLGLAGGLLGIPAAIAYSELMVYGLKTWWNAAIGTQFLFVSLQPMTLLIGFALGAGMGWLAIWWGLRLAHRISPRDQLHGVTTATPARPGKSPTRTPLRIAAVSLIVTVVLTVASFAGLVPRQEAFGGISWNVVTFFLMGLGALVGSCALATLQLSHAGTIPVSGHGWPAYLRLGVRNAGRNRQRSLMTICLIASATFVIVAVGAGKRDPVREQPVIESGNGGYALFATSTQPVLYDLNTKEGREKLSIRPTNADDARLWESLRTTQFRVRPGDDASCRNLFTATLPTILGVPDEVLHAFDEQHRFRFADTPTEHPWTDLLHRSDDGRIPVIGDMNTLVYSLKKGIGSTIRVPPEALADAQVDSADLAVTGMLDGSILQGVLLMSESHFQELFPQIAGFRYFLIEVDPAQAKQASTLLESGLEGSGFDVESVAEQLASFLAVQNTYLSTFQTLGGLGLLLGTFGLATVMLRNVLERRRELALLRAVGLRDAAVVVMVLAENAFLLFCGLAVGSLSALLAMLPHLQSTGADVSWLSLLGMLGIVGLFGLFAPAWGAREAVRPTVLAGLRGE
jgi:putative ABC transport system permease protein